MRGGRTPPAHTYFSDISLFCGLSKRQSGAIPPGGVTLLALSSILRLVGNHQRICLFLSVYWTLIEIPKLPKFGQSRRPPSGDVGQSQRPPLAATSCPHLGMLRFSGYLVFRPKARELAFAQAAKEKYRKNGCEWVATPPTRTHFCVFLHCARRVKFGSKSL